MFLISLDELERVKRVNGIRNATDLAARTGLSRNTWNTVLKHRKPTPQVLNALAKLGARANKVLVEDDLPLAPGAAA